MAPLSLLKVRFKWSVHWSFRFGLIFLTAPQSLYIDNEKLLPWVVQASKNPGLDPLSNTWDTLFAKICSRFVQAWVVAGGDRLPPAPQDSYLNSA